MNPLVSIITPVFNRTEFIEETIKSVINQTYQNWEYIIVDDGSKKENLEYIKTQVKKDSRIKLLQRNRLPKGASTCRNIGIKESKGDYLMFLDSDDLLAKNGLIERMIYMREHPDCDLAIFPILIFDNNTRKGDLIFLKDITKFSALDFFLQHNIPWSNLSTFWKREAMLSINMFSPYFQRFQDVELHIRALVGKLKISISSNKTPDSFYRRYITSEDNYEKTKKSQRIKSAYLLISMITDIVPNHKKSIKIGYQKIFWNYIFYHKKNPYAKAYVSLGQNEGLFTFTDSLFLVILTKMEYLNLHKKKFTGYYRLLSLLQLIKVKENSLKPLSNQININDYL